MRKGNKYFEHNDFALALAQYELAAAKRTPDLPTAQRIADAYRLTQRSQEAENWYAKVVAMPGRDPMNLYYYAEALRSNGNYEHAKEQYMRWTEEMPQQADRAQELMQATDQARKWMNKLPLAEVTRVQGLNAEGASDFSPVPYGNDIIFSSDRGGAANTEEETFGWTGRPYLKLYTAQKDAEGNWGAPVALPAAVNTTYHNATASAPADGNELYFTKTKLVRKDGAENPDPTSWVSGKSEAEEYVNRLEIYVARKAGDAWSEVQPFAYNKVEEYSVAHPALSPDGQLLYFVSDMPGGSGGTDIYYSVRQADGSWGQPVNAGSTINTPWRESFPYVDADGRLFFSSEGHTGMGGLDIFRAEGQHAAWSGVRNMGYPVNSSKNDFGIMFDSVGVTGLLSSNRDAANGTDDIYRFTILNEPMVLAISTVERIQNKQKRTERVPLPNVRVAVKQESVTDSTVVTTNAAGKYFLDARKGYTYTFLGSKTGYLSQSEQVQVPKTAPDTVQVTLLFYKSEINRAIVLENIYYDLDKWDIRPDAARELDKLVKVLKTNPGIKIELSSHTDSRESQQYNQQLSERRAQAAVDYLVSRGISRSRLTAKGYGKTRLINHCADGVECSEEEHQLNRRTEFMIK